MLSEELRSLSPNRRQLRSFGITLGIALLVIAGVLFWRNGPGVILVSSIGLLFLIAGLTAPAILRRLYRPWMALAVLMGFVMTRILLTLIFVLLFIPTGLLMRLFGRDPLRRKLDPDAKSYWIRKQYDPKSRERLERYY